MRALPFLLLIFLSPAALAAYDANGVELGATEAQVRKQFPSAHCKELEWESRAADRRCDDSRITFGGVEARVTFYLRKDKVEAFDVRFDSQRLPTVLDFVKQRYGKPASEQKDTIGDKKPRQVFKALWEDKGERAALVSQTDKRQASLLVSRGNFEEEIYRVR